MEELSPVVLTHDVGTAGLRQGDVGAIVHVYRGAQAYEVEFVTASGTTVALLTLTTNDIRPLNGSEILHVRDFSDVA